MALEDKKVDPDAPVDESIATAIRSRLEHGNLPCSAACELAAGLDLSPIEVGRTADQIRIRIDRCQLGLFGYPGHASGWEGAGVAAWPVPDGLAESLRAAADGRGGVPCDRLWEVARRFEVPRIQVGWLADRLGLTVRECHLGTF